MKARGCDAKILSLHRGAEYRFSPNQRQQNLARTLIDAGADLILGGHSHIPGVYETYQGKYIFYSLGNFIFDQGRGKTASGSAFDYLFDYTLQRKTVPTYLAMLVGLNIYKLPSLNGKKG
jgi:poly-gamma-glutamate capsule biosynthesis protein CapA/YwtB (metallophosphatase superfamily)